MYPKKNQKKKKRTEDHISRSLNKLVERIAAPNIIISDFKISDVPDIITFQKEFLGRESLSQAQIDAYHALWGEVGGEWSTRHHEAVLLVGMKGGKNFWSEGDIAYTVFYISALKDPHAYFSKITKRRIPFTLEKNFDIVNVSSISERQATRAFFDSAKNVFKLTKDPTSQDNWFEKYAGLDLRNQFGDLNKNEIIFPTQKQGMGGIRLLSYNSKAATPEGLHIFRFYADELSRAETPATFKEAKKLLQLGLSNTNASFPNNVGKVIGWSYPNDTDFDLTVERYNLSLSNEHIYGIKASTWEFNPAQSRELLDPNYKSDPVGSRCRYECEKGVSKESFFAPYVEKIEQMIDPTIPKKIEYQQKTETLIVKGVSYKFSTVEIQSLKGDYKNRCFAFDASKVKDKFVILGGFAETISPLELDIFIEGTEQIKKTNVRPKIDIAIVIEPSKDAPIDYVNIGDLFSKLLYAFPNTQSISSDHFQNEKLRQEILNKGIKANTYPFTNNRQVELYTNLRANAWNNNILVIKDLHQIEISKKKMSFAEGLIFEAKHIRMEGNKILHPSWGSKDILDALAILNWDLMRTEVMPFVGNIDNLTDEQLRELADRFMDEKYKLILQPDIPKQSYLSVIAERLMMNRSHVEKLAAYVKRVYDY